MANFFQCCKRHTINLDLVCYATEQNDALSVSFGNGIEIILEGKCKELVKQSLSMKAYYSNNL